MLFGDASSPFRAVGVLDGIGFLYTRRDCPKRSSVLMCPDYGMLLWEAAKNLMAFNGPSSSVRFWALVPSGTFIGDGTEKRLGVLAAGPVFSLFLLMSGSCSTDYACNYKSHPFSKKKKKLNRANGAGTAGLG
ncbi:hypothetical protein BS78_08G033100 [Paspalum vaginatum]|nr:hypothetical protein BS78_08G033100 [Paspalum vaginatum]